MNEGRVPYSDTSVPPERSQVEIQKLLYRHGAQGIQWTELGDQLELKFLIQIEGRPMTVRIRPAMLLVRKRTEGRRGSVATMPSKAATFRLLYFYLKSQLEAVQYGLVTFQEAFLAHVAGKLPTGEEVTIGELLIPKLQALELTELARALPAGEPHDQEDDDP